MTLKSAILGDIHEKFSEVEARGEAEYTSRSKRKLLMSQLFLLNEIYVLDYERNFKKEKGTVMN